MPDSSPFNSVLREYPLRVDNFTNSGTIYSALNLLTHSHSDHTLGLASKTFTSQVICSYDTRNIVLNIEPATDRVEFDKGNTSSKNRTFSHLHVRRPVSSAPHLQGFSRDLLKPLPLDTPTFFELSDKQRVRITLIDANHCPGSVMFLIEGDAGAVLHTGDVRADENMIRRLRKNPYLAPYIKPHLSSIPPNPRLHTLQSIYLDTTGIFGTRDIPSSSQACRDLVKLLHLFPRHCKFFINTWTWGWEELLKSIAVGMRTKIHVDRYKFEMYNRLSDRELRSFLTLDPLCTRFHACERSNRCQEVAESNSNVHYINPVVMTQHDWQEYVTDTEKEISEFNLPSYLKVAFARHSTLNELQSLVSLFCPRKVVPNDLTRSLHGVDWLCMLGMFGSCIRKEGILAMWQEMKQCYPSLANVKSLNFDIGNLLCGEEVVARENLVVPNQVQLALEDAGSLEFSVDTTRPSIRATLKEALKKLEGVPCAPKLFIADRAQPLVVKHDSDHSSDEYDSDEHLEVWAKCGTRK